MPLALAAGLSLACAQLPHPKWPTLRGARSPTVADPTGRAARVRLPGRAPARARRPGRRGARRLPARAREGSRLPVPAPHHRRVAGAQRSRRRRRPLRRARAAARARRRRPAPLPRHALPHPQGHAGGGAHAAPARTARRSIPTPRCCSTGSTPTPIASTPRSSVAKWMVKHRSDEPALALRARARLRAHAAPRRFRARAARGAEAQSRQSSRSTPGSRADAASAATARARSRSIARCCASIPTTTRRSWRSADAQIDMQRLDDARRTLEIVEKRHPDDLRSVVRLGYLDLEQKRFPEAEARFQRVLASNPEQADVHYFLGTARRQANNLPGAIEEYEKVPTDHERYLDARLQLAAIYERQHDFARALSEAEAVRAALPVAPDRPLRREPARQVGRLRRRRRVPPGPARGVAGRRRGALQPRRALRRGEPPGRGAAATWSRCSPRIPSMPARSTTSATRSRSAGRISTRPSRWSARRSKQRPDDGYIVDSLGWVYYVRARTLLGAGQTSGRPRGARAARSRSWSARRC